MTCEYTWPNHLMATDREATQALLEQHGFQDDVAYGHSKVFIRTPRTLFSLEQERAQLIPIIVLLLQKVGWRGGDIGVTRGRTRDWHRVVFLAAGQGMGPAPGSPKHSWVAQGTHPAPQHILGLGAALWGPSPPSREPGTALLPPPPQIHGDNDDGESPHGFHPPRRW